MPSPWCPRPVRRNVELIMGLSAGIGKSTQHESVGITLDVMWFEPMTNSSEDIAATQRAQDFQFGWFIDPLVFGDYPISMRTRVKNRLPRFTGDESALIKGSLDFVGINHYTTYYAQKSSTDIIGQLLNDTLADSSAATPRKFVDLRPIGDRANSIWLYIVPRGMRSLMNYIKQKYSNPPVFITENEMDDPNSPFISIEDALKDDKRIMREVAKSESFECYITFGKALAIISEAHFLLLLGFPHEIDIISLLEFSPFITCSGNDNGSDEGTTRQNLVIVNATIYRPI
uniref:Uncharacterized protein n=1 Tax=Ananas comosus var. bracteatus TaxID=296719 RepID=A0A6V7NMK0_ANACO|nr:unnamed protein product [Ananas comosus var. bracteatus]